MPNKIEVKPIADNIKKETKDKMDIIFANQSKKELKYMAWFEIRPGYHRCIGVNSKKEVEDLLTPEEMKSVSFNKYSNPKVKGDQRLDKTKIDDVKPEKEK